MRGARAGVAIAATLLCVGATACTSVVDATAVRGGDASPGTTTILGERDLDSILLDERELNDLLGSSLIEVTGEVDKMTDDTADVSDPECVGALYTAEEPVYADTGYTAVLTRLASESGDDYEHWVEESGVVLPTADAAEKFVAESATQWEDCGGQAVSVSDGDDWYDWDLNDAVTTDGILSQKSTALDSIEWECEHALVAVSNVVLEASVCAERIADEASVLLTEMVAKASQR
ncbi:sensor domain-containing protein [Mycobacterium sp. 236(2023)]|uniref:sensor domain-containing protein n=1 Tax=Mycobacterium sp. 236(2023) TaxID=3038163 RepID=UPI002414F8C8|nr:sensor domain-containing protein [Mycobacterium sp. 236(2023)]MDG4667672.1 sensor domain-containing protein [Mycobacterium sp. 236(2023)]